MFQGKRFVAVIPARGGSKGIPRKNLREIAGKPLISYSIDAALASKYVDRVILSSEDSEIIEAAKNLGCDVPFTRPLELSGDDVSSMLAVKHAVDMISGFDYVVLLQPTSPLRTSADIDGTVEQCFLKSAKCCVSVTESSKSPYWMYELNADGKMQSVLEQKVVGQRQALPKAYVLNGAVYVAEIDWLKGQDSFMAPNTVAYVMPAERSVDIDSELDMLFAEICLANGVLSA